MELLGLQQLLLQYKCSSDIWKSPNFQTLHSQWKQPDICATTHSYRVHCNAVFSVRNFASFPAVRLRMYIWSKYHCTKHSTINRNEAYYWGIPNCTTAILLGQLWCLTVERNKGYDTTVFLSFANILFFYCITKKVVQYSSFSSA